MQADTNKLVQDVVERLSIVKEEYIRLKKNELVSIRRDVLKAELQNILNKSNSYEDLQSNLKEYIDNLLILEGNNE